MAVLESCPGLKVEVVANGNPLREYIDSESEDIPNTTASYVEVTTEGTFQIVTHFLEEFVASYGVRVKVLIDGNKVNSYIVRLKDLKKADGHTSSGTKSKIRGRWHRSDFRFSSFTVEQDSERPLDRSTSERLKQTGTITVVIHRIKNIRWPRKSRRAATSNDVPHGINPFETIPEKSIQALGLSHHGSVDQPRKQRRGNPVSFDYVDGEVDDAAFATFHFKYRSLVTLKALRIVPHTPEPALPPPNVPLDSGLQILTLGQPDNQGQDGLSTAELVAIIKTYRGGMNGLEGLSKRDLVALLNFHRNADAPSRAVKREHDEAESSIDPRSATQGRQIIVIDD